MTVLIFSLRSGVLELLIHSGNLSPPAALALTAVASGLVMQTGYRLRAQVGWRELAMAIVGYAFLLRLVYAAQVELLPEETYYWNYSRHLDIGYLDHPPMVAWLIRLGTTLFGNTQFGVRVGAVGCAGIMSVFVFRLTRNLFDETSAVIALVLAQILPFFFLSGLLMTPDAPLTAAWAASLYFLERALVAQRPRAWLWLGVSLGIGLLSKYTIGLLGGVAILFMFLDRPSRRWFFRWEPYAAASIAAAVFAPVVLWNAQHHWASFSFQTSRRLAEHPRFSLHKLIGGALILITPTGVSALVATFARGGLPGNTSRASGWRLLRIAVLVPLTVFFFFSLRHEVKLDWTGAPWIAALPVLARGITEGYRTGDARAASWLKAAWPHTARAMLLVYALGLYYLVLGIPGVGYSAQIELIPVAWRDLARQIDEVAHDLRTRDERLLIVGMDRYAIASELAFYSHDQTVSVASTSTGHLFGGMGLMYEQWFPVESQVGRTLLLVSWDAGALDMTHLQDHVAAAEPIREGSLFRNGSLVRHYYYRVAYGLP